MVKSDKTIPLVLAELPQDFVGRLNWCAEQVGGKRELAEVTGISEPQLYRYLRGEGEPPVGRVQAIADAAQVDVGWVITGEGRPEPEVRTQPVYDSAVYLETRRLVEEAWGRIEREVSDEAKAMILDLILFERLQQAYRLGAPYPLTLNWTISQLLYLLGFDADSLAVYRQVMGDYFSNGRIDKKNWTEDKLQALFNAMSRACIELFNGPHGVVYFDRMGQTVWPQAAQRLTRLVNEIYEIHPLRKYKWLDVGCGNGREISFLHRNFEHIEVYGIDASDYSLELCAQQVATDNLPAGRVEQADARFYKSEQLFDVIYSRVMLDRLPYVPYSDNVGTLQVVKQLGKSLAPGGIMYLIVRRGSGLEFGLPRQEFDEDIFKDLAVKLKMDLIKSSVIDINADKFGTRSRYDDCIAFVLKKPG